MSQDSSDESNSVFKQGLLAIKDLAFSDTFILQYLARFQGPVVRITLLETLNSLLSGGEMSPSSFYSRLKKLKKLGYVQEENARSRNQTISITPLGLKALRRISQINILGSVNFNAHTLEIIPKVIRDLPEVGQPSENMLLMNLEEGLDLETLKTLNQFGKTNYISASDEIFMRYKNMGLPTDIIQSRFEVGQVHMPDAFFDRVLILGLECMEVNERVTRALAEAYRLLKPSGLVVIATIAELPDTNHFLLEGLVDDVVQNRFVKLAREE
ncbi:MAG: methyltransferase domain-containing protein, partial [Candidatus Kariarchaeaceae archaeon]